MRKAGVVTNSEESKKLAAAFYGSGIEAQVYEENGSYTFWVVNEADLDQAKELFEMLSIKPESAIFKTKLPDPTPPRASAPAANRAKYVDVRREIFSRSRAQKRPVTIFLIGTSVICTLLMNYPGAIGFIRSLFFSEYMSHSFPEIRDGQVWRLITPIFLHGGFLHLLFNMWWMYDLGGVIEHQEKPWYLAILVLFIAAISNTAQYVVAGPNFYGMSGVVYGLLGYIWMMSVFSRRQRYFISQSTITIMMLWLVACLVGIIPGVANGTHVAGLVAGSGWGYLRARFTK